MSKINLPQLQALTEAKANNASQESQDAYNLLKKLKYKGVRNAAQLEQDVEYKEAFANVGEAKSIWRGKNGMPAGKFLFLQFGGNDVTDIAPEDIKRNAGMTPEQALEVLTKAGVKHKKTLRKTFG